MEAPYTYTYGDKWDHRAIFYDSKRYKPTLKDTEQAYRAAFFLMVAEGAVLFGYLLFGIA